MTGCIMKSLLVCLACALVITEVASFTPAVALDEMAATDACDFMCMLCFGFDPKYTDYWMNCSNIVCSPTNDCHQFGLVWLGMNCKFPENIQTYVPLGANPPVYKAPPQPQAPPAAPQQQQTAN